MKLATAVLAAVAAGGVSAVSAGIAIGALVILRQGFDVALSMLMASNLDGLGLALASLFYVIGGVVIGVVVLLPYIYVRRHLGSKLYIDLLACALVPLVMVVVSTLIKGGSGEIDSTLILACLALATAGSVGGLPLRKMLQEPPSTDLREIFEG